MRDNLQAGLFLIGLGSAVLFAWWSGAFALIGDEIAGRVRESDADVGAVGPVSGPATFLAPQPARSA